MRTRTRLISLFACFLLMAVSLTACAKKEVKKGKVVIKNYHYVVRPDSAHVFAVDAVGSVENIGDCAVRNVIVTGACPTCQLKWIEGKWFTSNVPNTPSEEAKISYLAKGASAKFRVRDIAMMMHNDNEMTTTPKLPKKMVVKIQSFDSVQ